MKIKTSVKAGGIGTSPRVPEEPKYPIYPIYP
jgi:hypothetical protein